MDRLIEGSRRLFAGEEDVNFSDLCIDSYVSMAVECIAQIRSVPELLSMPGNLPALVHCTAGKWTEHTSTRRASTSACSMDNPVTRWRPAWELARSVSKT